MENDPRTTATDLRQQGATSLAISWLDGAQTVIEVRDLRLACACAHCVDEWTGENRLDPGSVPDDVHPMQIEAVGRYAIQIQWSDGHDSGIYPYVRLRALSEGVAGP
ncbi:MAG: DUF971 domain-containing protein [Myxococcota bacterium]|nr:DUF971 domain-containing protein [Myxococcota bacterium]